MSRWLRLSGVRLIVRPWRSPCISPWRTHARFLSANSSVEYVEVPCGSAGSVLLSLHNISRHSPTTPLVIFIPPFSPIESGYNAPLPRFLDDHPTAVINYRWRPSEPREPDEAQKGLEYHDLHKPPGRHDQGGGHWPEDPLPWPIPLHDVTIGYSWIKNNLGSGTYTPRKPRHAYVYGSYLGASLATGLAFTESHFPHLLQPMTIRGLIAHNGIYNWSMFLPDHPIHEKKRKRRNSPDGLEYEPIEEPGVFTDLKHHMPALFSEPSNLFDPFASACYFFHTANLYVPEDFTTPLSDILASLSPEMNDAIDALASSTSLSAYEGDGYDHDEAEEHIETADELLRKASLFAKKQKAPRKSYFTFPPQNSGVRLPSTLLLHSAPVSHDVDPTTDTNHEPQQQNSPQSTPKKKPPPAKPLKPRPPRNSFTTQALELGGLMMRSMDMYEPIHISGTGFYRSPRPGPPPDWLVNEGDAEHGGLPTPMPWVSTTCSSPNGAGGEQERERLREIERRVQSYEMRPAVGVSLPTLGRMKEGVDGEVGGHESEVDLGLELDEEAEQVVAEWLREKIEEDLRRDGRGRGR
ncbi:uncharacterized protein C8A04DRAFT_9077 [Dichotomopilus funicola]|uniref:Uncharacterized protein n=1 Tax=Dichotomopilus funicola TaxID=1934379 RepID=A0AAN6V9X2_9PEZI|nr:hypothetical protein C8A04DRAFT_9077 [Dichotomopilus funicola]